MRVGRSGALASIALLAGCSFAPEVPSNLSCTSTDDCLSVRGICVVRADGGGVCCLTADCLPLDGGEDAPAVDSRSGVALDMRAPPATPPEQLAWIPPATIPTGPTKPINPRLAGDAAGNVAVVWQDDLGGLTQLWWNRRRAGADWEIAEPVQDSFGYSDGHPDDWATRIAINGRHAYVAWRTIDPMARGPYTTLRHFSDDVGWEKPAAFTGYGPPSVIAQPDGALALFCSDSGGYYYSRHSVGSGWSDPELIADGCTDPAVGANQSGAMVAVTTAGMVISTASYAPESGSWMVSRMDPVSMGPMRWTAMQPAIALNNASDSVIGWRTMNDDFTESLWITTSLGFARWEKATTIDTQVAATTPRVAISDAQVAVMVWQHATAAGQGFEVMASRRDPGGWSTPERLGGGANDPQSGPQVALDPYGNGTAVWAQDEGDAMSVQTSIWTSRLLSSRGWGMARRIGDDPTPATGTPSVVMDDAGRAVAVWRVGSTLRWSALE